MDFNIFSQCISAPIRTPSRSYFFRNCSRERFRHVRANSLDYSNCLTYQYISTIYIKNSCITCLYFNTCHLWANFCNLIMKIFGSTGTLKPKYPSSNFSCRRSGLHTGIQNIKVFMQAALPTS